MDPLHETLTLSIDLSARPDAVWGALSDTSARARWSVPEGEAMIFDDDDFRAGGHARYRCGPPEDLAFAATVEYLVVEPDELLVHTDTVRHGDTLLSTALLTWHLVPTEGGTTLHLVDQVVSFVDPDMIDGHRNGHTKALSQLAAYLG